MPNYIIHILTPGQPKSSNSWGVSFSSAFQEYSTAIKDAIEEGVVEPKDGDIVTIFGSDEPRRVYYATVAVQEPTTIRKITFTALDLVTAEVAA